MISALFHIHDAQDWLVLLWLREEREYAKTSTQGAWPILFFWFSWFGTCAEGPFNYAHFNNGPLIVHSTLPAKLHACTVTHFQWCACAKKKICSYTKMCLNRLVSWSNWQMIALQFEPATGTLHSHNSNAYCMLSEGSNRNTHQNRDRPTSNTS